MTTTIEWDPTEETLAEAIGDDTEFHALKIINGEELTDLSPLANLTQLNQLDLSGCKALTDLSLLANLTQLTNLNLMNG